MARVCARERRGLRGWRRGEADKGETVERRQRWSDRGERKRQHDRWMEKREGGGGEERRVEADGERGERWRCGKLMGGHKQRPRGQQLQMSSLTFTKNSVKSDSS